VPVPLSVSERDFLTFDQIPADLNRGIVPVFEMSHDTAGSPVVAPVGTAFIIGQTPSNETVFVTAAHNIPEPSKQNECHLVVLLPKRGATAEFNDLQGFIVSGASIAETSSDIALMVATIDDTVQTPMRLTLGLEIPAVDENCLALGYSTMTIGHLSGLNGNVDIRLSSSRGKIEEVHPSFRDNVKVTFPSFRTDALYSRGMSGGPVLGTSGRVIGIVSTCMESSEEGVPHTSYCALVAGLFELDVPMGEDSETTTIADLRNAGLVAAEGLTTTITRADGRVIVSWPESGDPPT